MKTIPIPSCFGAVLFFILIGFRSGLPAAILTSCTEAGLRSAVGAGGRIVFACDGVISFSSPMEVTQDVVLDGGGRDVVLSGNKVTGLFVVKSNASLVLSNLNLIHGRASAGAGVYNEGRLRAVKCGFVNCWALGRDSQPTNAVPISGTTGEGGAIWNSGVAELVDCYLERNIAVGGTGPIVKSDTQGTYLMEAGGFAGTGGGIHNLGELIISGSYFTNNGVSGGTGNAPIPALRLPQGNGAEGLGGGVYSQGKVWVRNSVFYGNNAYFGGVVDAQRLLRGMGGALCSLGTLQLTNVTILECEAIGHPGGGGGVCVLSGTADIAFTTLIRNHAGTNPSGEAGRGAAIYSETNATTRVTHTIVAYSKAFVRKSPLIHGEVTDLGYNLSSDVGSVFNGPGSMNGLDPQLTSPKFYGGRLLLPLPLEGSPVVDAGLESGLVEDDQRGFSRPHGPRYDLGAAEGPLVSVVANPVFSSPLVVGQQAEATLVVSNANRFPLSGVELLYYPPNTVKVVDTKTVEGDCPATTHLFGWYAAMGGFSLAPGDICRFRVPLSPSQSGLWNGDRIQFNAGEVQEYRLITRTLTVVGVPVVATRSASGAQADRVTMNGTVHPGGLASMAWFEYGTSSNALTEVTSPQPLTPGYEEVSMSASRSGLIPNTRFYYRMVGSNELGVVRGDFKVGYTLGDTVFACEEGNLVSLMAGGGRVRFDCDGIVTLSAPLVIKKDTVLLADGHSVAISGSNIVRLFEIPAGIKLTLDGIILTAGSGTNGGAIYNRGHLEARNCILSNNHARAVEFARPAGGGALWNEGFARLERCRLEDNTTLGSRGVVGVFEMYPGTGRGGAIANWGSLELVDSLLQRNRALGGVGAIILTGAGPGGFGHGGAIYNAGNTIVLGSTFHENSAVGGPGVGIRFFGGAGGDAYGGAIYSTNHVVITNSTFHANQSIGGAPGQTFSPFGKAYGGALTVSGGDAAIGFTTLAYNRGTNGGGAILVLGSATAEIDHTLIAHSDPNASLVGNVLDRGYNLSSDAPAAMTQSTSLRGVDTRLGVYGEYGGTTPTLALLPMSPALDGGAKLPSGRIAKDQRGLPRPALAALDIGAFEVQPTTLGIRSMVSVEVNRYRLTGFGRPGAGFEIEGQIDGGEWNRMATGVMSDAGLFDVVVDGVAAHQFLRLRVP